MIIQIVSDLHLEYLEEYDLDSLIEKKNANILVLVGDIGSLYRYPQLIGFLDKVCRIYEYVLYVPGNHEYYKMNTNDVGICMKDLKQKMNDLETIFKNLIILDNEKNNIMSIVAHDLKGPLSNVEGLLGLLSTQINDKGSHFSLR